MRSAVMDPVSVSDPKNDEYIWYRNILLDKLIIKWNQLTYEQ